MKQILGPSAPLTKASAMQSGKVSLRVECDPDAFNDVITYMCRNLPNTPGQEEACSLALTCLIGRYCGRISVRAEHAVELLSICLHYEIEPLSRLFSQYLDSYLSVDTVNVLLTSALQVLACLAQQLLQCVCGRSDFFRNAASHSEQQAKSSQHCSINGSMAVRLSRAASGTHSAMHLAGTLSNSPHAVWQNKLLPQAIVGACYLHT
jgi:hypothetical protein